MIAANSGNGTQRDEVVERLIQADEAYWLKRHQRDAQSSYRAGETSRMNPVPKGIDPLGTDADYHYRTERNYFLMVERGREAVRNHPLVEQGINRLIANLRLRDFVLDVDSGDDDVSRDIKAKFRAWAGETQAGRNLCDHEETRNLDQIATQSFFSQVQDGDIVHLLLANGRIQTWESHHLRNPFGHRNRLFANSEDGIVHGVEVRSGKPQAYWITPSNLAFYQAITRRGQSRRVPIYDSEGNKLACWLGFTHRFRQRRGISRLSPPRDAMNGFDDLNFAHTKAALRRALISFLMKSKGQLSPQNPYGGSGTIPQSGPRRVQSVGDATLGIERIVIEQLGEPAQVMKAPEGYDLEGWNANLPPSSFFEHASLMLTMLAVNLDLPLSFLLLDGSLVNFHGGRMTFDQVKLRMQALQADQIAGFWNPVYEWKVRQWTTPGSDEFDPALTNAANRSGINLLNYKFRPKGWPYVKPMEDAAAEQLAETSNNKSRRSILAERGVDHDEHAAEVIRDRGYWARIALAEATKIAAEYPAANIDIGQFFRELWYGPNPNGVQLSLNASGDAEPPAGERRGT